MNKIISVIVPVYNVVKYLRECVNSLTSQTYQELEIILVDDGSTDGSGELCDILAKQDTRIKVIHQQNGGAASAKNAGLRAASGTYLAFVDSDDYLELDAYEFMLNAMQKYGADVVRCGFENVFVDYMEEHTGHLVQKTFSGEKFLEEFTRDWTCGLLWDKLYRRKLFEGIFFEEGHKIDDEFFTYQGIMRAKMILQIPRVIYHYRKRKSSIMCSKDSQNQLVLDKLEYSLQRRKKVIATFPALRDIYNEHYVNFLILLCRDPGATEASLNKAKKQIREYLSENFLSRHDMRIKIVLLKILLTSNKQLLASRETLQEQINPEHFFE